MNRRGRREKLNDGIKIQISQIQNGRAKKLKAPAVREELRKIIEEQMRKRIKDGSLNWRENQIHGEVEGCLPGVSSIQKYMKELNPRLDKILPIDTPWHLGTFRAYPMPHEAIPLCLKVGEWVENSTFPQLFPPLTIRQAQWVARLYTVIKKDTRFLYIAAEHYAIYEKTCEFSNTLSSLDTSSLDRALHKGEVRFEEAFDKLMHKIFHTPTWQKLIESEIEFAKKSVENLINKDGEK